MKHLNVACGLGTDGGGGGSAGGQRDARATLSQGGDKKYIPDLAMEEVLDFRRNVLPEVCVILDYCPICPGRRTKSLTAGLFFFCFCF